MLLTSRWWDRSPPVPPKIYYGLHLLPLGWLGGSLAPLAQSGEHGTVTAEARGSKPLRCAKNIVSCDCGEIGILSRLKICRFTAWRFDPAQSHQSFMGCWYTWEHTCLARRSTGFDSPTVHHITRG